MSKTTPILGRPTSDFDLWLREQARCANCETYYGLGTCGHPKSNELEKAMAEASGVPVQGFRVDPNASAKFCPLWEAEIDWRQAKSREWDNMLAEERSANEHYRAVDAVKGYGKP